MFFPPQAVLVFSDATHFLTELYASFCSLCCDPEVSVRQSAAACFHQVGCHFMGLSWRDRSDVMLKHVASHLSIPSFSGRKVAWIKRPVGSQGTPYSAARRCSGGQSTSWSTSPCVVYMLTEVFLLFFLLRYWMLLWITWRRHYRWLFPRART